MDKKKKKPALRFAGFDDDWEQRKFGDCNDLITGYPFESEKFTEQGIKLVRGMNVKRGYLDFADEICMMWDSSEGLENFLLENNDILIQMDGALIGKSFAKIKQSQLPALLVQRVTRARTKRTIADSNFMYQTIQKDFLHYIAMNKTETAVPHLSLNDIREFKINVPSLEEQQRIGRYFEILNHLITLHQRKLDKMKKFKKAMLEKMFPKKDEKIPEVRFVGFTDDWEQRKLGEIVNVCSGRDYKHLSEGSIPVYGTGGYMLSVNEALSYSEDAIGIGRKGTIDKPYILKAPFWTVDTLFYAVPEKLKNIDFIFDIFQKIDWRKKDESTGVPSLSKEAINSTEIVIPKQDEQNRIGIFFHYLDHLITLHQRQLKKLKSIKKSMLEKMFV